ncbi:MAG: hypothetical protein ACP5Q4_09090 [Candidatus Caldatribacteriaceae bacterium]
MKRFLPLFMVLALFAVLFLAGCGGTLQPPTPTSQPMACSLRVISSCPDCWGNVYVNGFPTGQYLIANGAVTVSNVPCGQVASVYMIDENGWISHTEYVTVTGPNTLVNFTYWW